MIDLVELISRLCLAEPEVNSVDSVSWHAHRETERLSDPDLIEAAKAYLAKKRSKEERRAAYYILGKVGRNLASSKSAHYLLELVPFEKDKYALSCALDMIADLPVEESEDISRLTNLLLDNRWLVRHSAIRALRSSTTPSAETNLIALLESTTDDHDKVYCHSTLAAIGTEKSLSAIQPNVASRKRDVKASAVGAIEKIQQRVAAQQLAASRRP